MGSSEASTDISAENEEKLPAEFGERRARKGHDQPASVTVARRRRNLKKSSGSGGPRDKTPIRDIFSGRLRDEDDETKKEENGEERVHLSEQKPEEGRRQDEIPMPKTPLRQHRKSDPGLVLEKREEARKLSLTETVGAEALTLFHKIVGIALSSPKHSDSKWDASQPTSKSNAAKVDDAAELAASHSIATHSLEGASQGAGAWDQTWTEAVAQKLQKLDSRIEKPQEKVWKNLDVNVIKTVKRNESETVKPTSKRTLQTLTRWRNAWRDFNLEHPMERRLIRLMRNRCIASMVLVIIFCGLGGIAFKNLEGAFENYYKCGVKRVKRDFINALWQKSHNLREEDWKSLARTKLWQFEEELHAAHEAGMHSYSGQRSWGFLNSLFYSFTLITRIGYGHMYPVTMAGKAFTLVYALIGIPLFLIVLTDYGKLLTRCIKFLWAYIRRLYYTGSLRKVRRDPTVQDIIRGADKLRRASRMIRRPVTPAVSEPQDTPSMSAFEVDDEFNLPISVAIFILVMYIVAGSIVYNAVEDWGFLTSFYFVFISMTTVGFGDFVPNDGVLQIMSLVYLVFGLSLASMCINVVQVKLSDTFNTARNKLGETLGLGMIDEEAEVSEFKDGSTSQAVEGEDGDGVEQPTNVSDAQ